VKATHLRLVPAPPAEPASDDPCLAAFQSQVAYIFRTLRWLGARGAEIEDLAQEVFLALRQSWPRYDASRPLRPYLFGVAFRVVSMHQRKRLREVAFANLELHDFALNPDELLDAKQTRAIVLRAIEQVPLRRRAVLVMYDLDETPMDQVAAALSIPLFTAYSRLRKARCELRAAVRRQLAEGEDR
jgi:RNA polymerase sigma-70 factor (ECF subfamily)